MHSAQKAAFTVTEVAMSVAVAGLLMGAVVTGYVQCMRQAEWTSRSLAANSLAVQRMEQTRAATWDPEASVDQVVSTNFPMSIEVLDIPINKTNIVYATNYTTITVISTAPPLKMIRVDCVWPSVNGKLSTNTVATYRAPDT